MGYINGLGEILAYYRSNRWSGTRTKISAFFALKEKSHITSNEVSVTTDQNRTLNRYYQSEIRDYFRF